MRVFILGSGSSGNSLLLEHSSGARLFIDAGFAVAAATKRLRSLGVELLVGGASGIVVTHHHGDHVAHAASLARAIRTPVFMHRGIDAPYVRRQIDVREYQAGIENTFMVGPFSVRALDVPHDAPQVALAISDGRYTFGIATDLGEVPPGLSDLLGSCDVALLESNYCPMMLDEGRYPERLKARVRGPLGHLSNEQTAELASTLVGSRLSKLLLGHVSKNNNTPERAFSVVKPRCKGLELEVVPHGIPRAYDVASLCGPSPQLALAFA